MTDGQVGSFGAVLDQSLDACFTLWREGVQGTLWDGWYDEVGHGGGGGRWWSGVNQ